MQADVMSLPIGSSCSTARFASSVSEAESMTDGDAAKGARNVLGGPLQACCTEPGKVRRVW